MKKWVGWVCFLLIIVGLVVGGFFLVSSFDADTFEFKEVEILDYDDYSLNDFVKQDIICNDQGCKFKDKDVIFTISEVKELGVQDITLKLEYEGKKFEKTFRVDVVDKKTPEIVLSEKALIVDLNEEFDASSYIVEVKDNYDTLNVEDVSIENNVDLKNSGDYEIVYMIKDSSGNVGKSVLKVKVKGEKEVVSSNDDKKDEEKESESNPNSTEEESFKITWDYQVSGLFTDSGSLNQDQFSSSVEKNIEVGWDTTFKIFSTVSEDASIQYVISENRITKEPIIVYNGSPVVKTVNVKADSSSNYEYTFTEEGTYYILVTVKANNNQTVLKKEYVVHLTSPSELKDMKIITEDHGTYLTIDGAFVGGADTLYFDAAIQDSNDPNIEEAFVYENNEIRLYYTKGYYYEILGALFNEDGEMLLAKTLKIQK